MFCGPRGGPEINDSAMIVLLPPVIETKSSNSVAYREILFGGGGVQQIQVRTEDRENGDMGAVAPWSGVLEAALISYKKFHFVH